MQNIFVVGNSRSGTTMLGRVLGRNEEIHTFGELQVFNSLIGESATKANEILNPVAARNFIESILVRSRYGLWGNGQSDELNQAVMTIYESAEALNVFDLYAECLAFETRENGKVSALEQTPYYLTYYPEISEYLPGSKFICIVRDPRAVALSQKGRWKRRMYGQGQQPIVKEVLRSWCTYNPLLMAKIWKNNLKLSEKYLQNPNFYRLKYESLVSQPEVELRALCQFLEIKYSDSMLAVPAIGSSLAKDYESAAGMSNIHELKWLDKELFTENERFLVEMVVKQQIRDLGYHPPFTGRISVWSMVVELIGYSFKFPLLIVLNLISRNPLKLIHLVRRRVFGTGG